MLRLLRQVRHRFIRGALVRWLARQQGAVLFIALIALVAMTLAGIALVRSIDTATVISGNIAFRESATHSGDTGTEAAVAWLSASGAGPTLFTDHLDAGYVANGLAYQQPPPGQNWDQYWNDTLLPAGQITAMPTDTAGNTVSYVIHRLCYSAGDPLAPATGCATSLLQGGVEGSSQGAGAIALQGTTQVYYRVTSRIAGPKGTVSYVQTMILM